MDQAIEQDDFGRDCGGLLEWGVDAVRSEKKREKRRVLPSGEKEMLLKENW